VNIVPIFLKCWNLSIFPQSPFPPTSSPSPSSWARTTRRTRRSTPPRRIPSSSRTARGPTTSKTPWHGPPRRRWHSRPRSRRPQPAGHPTLSRPRRLRRGVANRARRGQDLRQTPTSSCRPQGSERSGRGLPKTLPHSHGRRGPSRSHAPRPRRRRALRRHRGLLPGAALSRLPNRGRAGRGHADGRPHLGIVGQGPGDRRLDQATLGLNLFLPLPPSPRRPPRPPQRPPARMSPKAPPLNRCLNPPPPLRGLQPLRPTGPGASGGRATGS
jgi:hypothetical protein